MAAAPVDGIAGELLDGVQGLAPVADEGAHILTLEYHLVGVILHGDHRSGLHAHVGEQAGLELHDGLSHRILAGSGGRLGLLSLGRGGLGLLRLLFGGLSLFRRRGGGLLLHRGSGRLLIGTLIGQLHFGRDGANAQKSGLAPLQDLHRDIVPLQTQLGKALGNGLIFGLCGDLNIS